MRWRTASGERLPASSCMASSAPPCCVTVSCASAPAKLALVNCKEHAPRVKQGMGALHWAGVLSCRGPGGGGLWARCGCALG